MVVTEERLAEMRPDEAELGVRVLGWRATRGRPPKPKPMPKSKP